MKIALVIEKLDQDRGGAARWTIQLGQWLLARGHQVQFVANRASDQIKAGHHVTLIDRSRDPLKNAARFDRLVAALDVDIVHDMGVGTRFDLLQSHFGSPTAHDAVRDAICSPAKRIYRRVAAAGKERRRKELHRRQFNSADGRFLAVSPKVANDLVEREGVSPDRIEIICNGVDASVFQPDRTNSTRKKTKAALGIETDELLLLFVAHHHRLKGLPTIFKALDALPRKRPPIRVLVAGGPRHKQKQIGGHRIRFLGNVAEMLQLYQSVDALVHPTRYDACSLCVLEAMACGLPAITTLENGASHFVDDGTNGLILRDPLDHRTLSCQIASLGDPSTRSAIGSNARASMAAWQSHDNFRAVERLYDSIRISKHDRSAAAA